MRLRGLECPDQHNSVDITTKFSPDSVPVRRQSRVQRWRKKLKEDNDEYMKFLSTDAARCKVNRLLMDDDHRRIYNASAKRRMQQYRARQKAKKVLTGTQDTTVQLQPSKPLTRADLDKQTKERETWRDKKRLQRAQISAQKRRRQNEKRRRQYQEAKALTSNNHLTVDSIHESLPLINPNTIDHIAMEPLATPLATSHLSSSSNTRVALHRARSSLPKSPKRFASVVQNLVDRASPRKKAALAKVGLFRHCSKFTSKVTKVVKVLFNDLRKKSKRASNTRVVSAALSVLKKYRLLSTASKRFGVPIKSITNRSYSKSRSDALPRSTITAVQEFLRNSATTLPDKKLVSKKFLEGKMLLDRPMREFHREFLKANPEIKIGISKFCSIRPKNVLLAKDSKMRQCLCEYCTNINLLLRSLSRLACNEHLVMDKVTDVYQLGNLTLCPKGEDAKFHNNDCIHRSCSKCGVRAIEDHYSGLMSAVGNGHVTWLQYETEKSDKNQEGHAVTRKILVTKTGTIDILLKELAKQAINITLHLHRALWQNRQFHDLQVNIVSHWVVMVLDFAENYTCNLQDEVQSCHWFHEQATVHPIVCYYRCPHCPDGKVTESIVFISSDKKHDHHAVHHFLTQANNHLQETRRLKIDKQIQFSDGCASQYKSKGPFSDISHSFDDFGFQIERCYFGSSHGKGPSDGESAVVKRQASIAVAAGTAVITSAENLFRYCKQNLTKEVHETGCTHFLRTFFWVGSDEIKRDRGQNLTTIKTVAGTRQLHSVKCIRNGVIAIRSLSCFCTSCISGNEERKCLWADYVSDWREVELAPSQLPVTANLVEDTQSSNHDKEVMCIFLL